MQTLISLDLQIIIIASIHQPSTTTFQLFDKLLLLSSGKTCYFGPVSNVDDYFRRIGHPIPGNTNPAEFLLDIVSSDFSIAKEEAQARVQGIQTAWVESAEVNAITSQISEKARAKTSAGQVATDDLARPAAIQITTALLHRSFIKSYRDVVAYGIRVVMYLGMHAGSLQQ